MNENTSSLHRIALSAAVAASFLLAGCDSDTQPLAPVAESEDELAEILFEAIQDEYHAEEWSTGNVPRFGSVPEACAVGADAEVANVAVYDELMAEAELPADVLTVFASNRLASLERHLPAFEACSY